MKRKSSLDSFLQSHSAWIEQLEPWVLSDALLKLCADLGLYIVNQDKKIIYWSETAEKLTGYGSTDLPDKAILTLIFFSDTDELIELPDPDGKPLKLRRSGQVIRDPAGNFQGGLGLLQPAPDALLSQSKIRTNGADPKLNFQGILSRSPAMKDVFQIIQNAAETAATVLVRGESGAGKELVAKAIHDLSARRHAPFLAINCAALSSNLLESELFGHVRGAFTGAVKDHKGLFQRAHGGTLFLDEVAELPLELQAKLLRVLQERNYIPVGGDNSIAVDVRIVAATHRSLREEVKAGRFREDLMYRLRVVPIFIPPLRERREDISLLIWHFIELHNAENFRKIDKIEPQAMKTLLDYAWPGNVRELHNVVEYAFAVGRGTTLKLSELPPEFREPRALEMPLLQKTGTGLSPAQEKAAIRQALAQTQGNINAAAELLGMSRATFWRKRKLHQE